MSRIIHESRAPFDPALKCQAKLTIELQVRSARYEFTIEEIRVANRDARRKIKRLRKDKAAIERSDAATDARKRIAELSEQVQMARLHRVHDAYLTSVSLPHTNFRPSAWWLPLIDPSGAWFQAMVNGAQARLEDI